MNFGGQPTPWSDEQIDGLRCRTVAQTLIEEIGADGPESAEDAAKRAVTVIQRQRDRIAALEAEKDERERQEPVAYRYKFPATFNRGGEIWKDSAERYNGSPPLESQPLYAAPPVPHVDPDWLAGVIRMHSPHDAVYALAEKIADAINGMAIK